MATVVWTEQALEDLDSICLYIARDAPRVAQLFAGRVFDAVVRLEAFPESGRIVPEIGDPKLREVIFGNYRILYRFHDETVEILTVHHGARLIDDRSF